MSNASAINLHDFSVEELNELSQLIYAEKEYRNNGIISEGLKLIKEGLEKICSVDPYFYPITNMRIYEDVDDIDDFDISASDMLAHLEKDA